jgi:hypothetical protein
MALKSAFQLIKDSISVFVKNPVILGPITVYCILSFFLSDPFKAAGAKESAQDPFVLCFMVILSIVIYLYTIALVDSALKNGRPDLMGSLSKIKTGILKVFGLYINGLVVAAIFFAIGFGARFVVGLLGDTYALMNYPFIAIPLFVAGGMIALLPPLFFWIYYILFAPIIVVTEGKGIRESMEKNKAVVSKNQSFLGSVLTALILFGILIMVCVILLGALSAPIAAASVALGNVTHAFVSIVFSVMLEAVPLGAWLLAYKEAAARAGV